MSFLGNFRALPTDDHTMVKKRVAISLTGIKTVSIIGSISLLAIIVMSIVLPSVVEFRSTSLDTLILVASIITGIFLFVVPFFMCLVWLFCLLQIRTDLKLLDARMDRKEETSSL